MNGSNPHLIASPPDRAPTDYAGTASAQRYGAPRCPAPPLVAPRRSCLFPVARPVVGGAAAGAFLLFVLLPCAALAQGAPGAAPVPVPGQTPISNLIVGLSVLLGLLMTCVVIWDKVFRHKPPLHRQYAEREHSHPELARADHTHPQYTDSDHLDAIKSGCAKERLAIRQESANQTERLERQLDHVRDAVTQQGNQLLARLDNMDERNEERIGNVYETIKPLASTVAANKTAICNHLEDHRAKPNNGGV